MKSITDIKTEQSSRIAKRLLNHWKHKFEVAENLQNFQIFMPTATVELTPLDNSLKVEIDFKEQDADQTRLENVVIDHLVRMGQEELTASWIRS
jgi:uncharacterized protein